MPNDPVTPVLQTGDPERWSSDPEQVERGYQDADPFEVAAQGHRFVFYPAGVDRLAALQRCIAAAKQTLEVFFYLFQPDEAGALVRDALVAAAERGVDVHLIVDDFGSDAPRAFFDPLVEAGGRFHLFQCRWSIRYLIRNHQKFVIADGGRVLTGGFNVSDHYFKPPEENGWCDLGVLIEGPVVERFGDWYLQLKGWVLDSGAQFRAIRKMVRDWDPGEGRAQLLLGGPTVITSAWARCLRKDLAAGRRLALAMAYFSPPRSFRQLIHRLGQRGKARLVMAGKSDNAATIGASRSLYRRMLNAGVDVREFQPCKLHMKLIVIDDICYFGSANMDMRSIRLNLELMVRIEDRALADRLRTMIDHMADHSEPITPQWLSTHGGWFNRVRWKLGYWLVSVLDYTVTRRLNLGM